MECLRCSGGVCASCLGQNAIIAAWCTHSRPTPTAQHCKTGCHSINRGQLGRPGRCPIAPSECASCSHVGLYIHRYQRHHLTRAPPRHASTFHDPSAVTYYTQAYSGTHKLHARRQPPVGIRHFPRGITPTRTPLPIPRPSMDHVSYLGFDLAGLMSPHQAQVCRSHQ